MQIATGTVVGGKVVIEDLALPDGAVVAVVSREPGQPFALSAQDEEELLAALEELERGEFVSANDLMESLRKYG